MSIQMISGTAASAAIEVRKRPAGSPASTPRPPQRSNLPADIVAISAEARRLEALADPDGWDGP